MKRGDYSQHTGRSNEIKLANLGAGPELGDGHTAERQRSIHPYRDDSGFASTKRVVSQRRRAGQ